MTPAADDPCPRMPEEQAGMGHIERTAFYFESGGQSLFAWLHRAAGAGDHGVLICPPLGHEQVHAHRTLRHLADRLAAAGFTVLRPDYHGTGDSDGAVEDPQRLPKWQTNVEDAAAWLRSMAGCRKISLVGLRFGAALAVQYAARHEVENLVLWAPVVKGRRYVRELTALAQTAQMAASEAEAGSIEAMGFVYTSEMAADLSRIDLLACTPRCQHALIAPISGDGGLLDHLAKQGVAAESVVLGGYHEMMAEPHDAVVPHEALKSITEWMKAKAPPMRAAAAISPSALVTAMQTGGVRESIHRISSAPDLFGILAEPAAHETALPWVVMTNAGAAYRVGPGRLHVPLARQLAELGYPSLRFDINGIGDSAAAAPDKENDTYAATAFRDVSLVCDYLRTRQPGRPIVLMGLCSGAYVAFQSAAQLPDPAIIESILINPLVFFWKEGMVINDTSMDQLVAWREYGRAFFKWSHWKKLLTGKTRTGFVGSIKRFSGHLKPLAEKVGKKLVASLQPARPSAQEEDLGCGHPARQDLAGDLQRIASAGRTLAMFVSDNDPGHFLMMYQARRKANQLIRQGRLQCHFIPNADHTFSTADARGRFHRMLIEYLHRRFGSTPSLGAAPKTGGDVLLASTLSS